MIKYSNIFRRKNTYSKFNVGDILVTKNLDAPYIFRVCGINYQYSVIYYYKEFYGDIVFSRVRKATMIERMAKLFLHYEQ